MEYKRIIAVIISVVAMLSACINCFAVDKNKNATYIVNVEMLKSDSEKTSMGNKYIAEKGILEIQNGKMTLTIAVLEGDDMKMWYYPGQSTQGDTKELTKISNVDIDGKTYAMGFAIPIESDTAYVKFHASIMPMTPSARIRMDLSSAKLISEEETTTEKITTEKSQENVTTIESASETETINEETTAAESTEAVSETVYVPDEIETAPRTEEESKVTLPVVLCFGAVILIIVAIIVKNTKFGRKK